MWKIRPPEKYQGVAETFLPNFVREQIFAKKIFQEMTYRFVDSTAMR